jgi:uncharacterized membrane protein
MSFDRKYLAWALCNAAAGMGLGIFMAASHNHAQHVTHAHILLVGFVGSFVYGVIHKLWLGERSRGLATAQFVVHQSGSIILFIALLLLYGGVAPEAKLAPILAAASMMLVLALVLMLVMVFKARSAASAQSAPEL